MHAASRTALTLFVLLFVGGCSWFSWLPFIDGKDEKSEESKLEPAKLEKIDAEVNVKRVWSRSIGEGMGKKYLRLNPLVLADRVFAADAYGRIEAMDRYSGKKVWQSAVDPLDSGFFGSMRFWDRRDPSFVSGGVGSGGGNLYLGTTSGTLIALSAADGTESWRTSIGSEILSTPASGDGLVFLQTIDGRLVALEDDSGATRWSYANQVPVLTLRGTSSPVYESGVVYTGFASGKVSALRSSNGEPVWEHRVMLPEGRSELDRMVDVDAAPLVNGGVIYAASFQGRVKAMRARDGGVIWEQPMSSFLDLAEGYGHIYVIDEDDAISAIDRESAEVVWQQQAFLRRKLSPPIAFSNYVLVGDEEGYLHVLAQSDGRLLGRRKLDGDGLRNKITVSDGTVYVLGNSGKLVALEIVAR